MKHGCDTDGRGKRISSADGNQIFTDQGNGRGQVEQERQEPDRSCSSCKSCQEWAKDQGRRIRLQMESWGSERRRFVQVAKTWKTEYQIVVKLDVN